MELIIIFIAVILAIPISLLAKNLRMIGTSSILVSLITLSATVKVALSVAASGTYTPFPIFSVDALGAIIIMIVSTVSITSTIYSIHYFRTEIAKEVISFRRVKQYFILSNLFIGALLLAAVSNSPILTWISIEATTLSVAFLISIYNRPSSTEAAWKYLIINSIGLLLGFFGTLLYFTALQPGTEGALTTWGTLFSNASYLNPVIAKIAFVFVLIGYGTKVGFAPMHTWKPDTYSKSPAPLGALFSGALMPVAFTTILRYKSITDSALGNTLSEHLLIIFGVLSIAVAALIVFSARNYKRLLAYSSIENAGIMALGFGFGGIAAPAALLHMIYHSLIKPTLFFLSGNVLLRFNSAKIAKVRGALTAIPMTGALFLTSFLAIAGTPPFGTFITKMSILSVGFKTHPVVIIVALFFSAILFVGFFKQIVSMMFGEKPAEINTQTENPWLLIAPLFLITLALILSFYTPHFITLLITAAAAH
jgi:hydrogenase-4 component F